MNTFTQSISKVFKGAFKAVQTYPASIMFALAFTIVTMVRIHLDWHEQESYNFLFNCLHWSFALGSIFSLATLTAAHSRFNTIKSLKITNIMAVIVVVLTLFSLYYLGGTDTGSLTSRFEVVSTLASTRVSVAIFVSFLAFILLAGSPEEQSDFSRSLFMTQKAFFIALIYGTVITTGASGVAAAFENLLYNDMSEKVYMYIASLSGFISFTIFVGYFPDFRKGEIDSHRETVQKQPQFIEVLFNYIMIPIMLALTVVLLLWTGRIVITGVWPVFIELSSIATTYAIGGIWLHMMVSRHASSMSCFYKRIYPITALVILAFEAQALLIQLGKFGLKTTEYYFVITWIIAVAAVVLMLVYKAKSYPIIVILVCIATIFSVLPLVGYNSMPVKVQVGRLERMLVQENILVDNQLIPTTTEPELTVRESITDAVEFLAYADDAELPDWFDEDLGESDVFKSTLGFEQTWPKSDYESNNRGYMGLSLKMPPESIDISGYEWMLTINENYRQESDSVTLETNKGIYQIYWNNDRPDGIPSLKVTLNDSIIIDEDMNKYLESLMEIHPLQEEQSADANLEDLTYKLENGDIELLLIFNNVDINVDPRNDYINYWLNLHAIYMHEKEVDDDE